MLKILSLGFEKRAPKNSSEQPAECRVKLWHWECGLASGTAYITTETAWQGDCEISMLTLAKLLSLPGPQLLLL